MPASTLQTAQRRFLFLQGPHGPFFSQLAKMLTAAGAEVWRVGFNAGDAFFWHDPTHFIPFQDSPENWEAALTKIVNDHGITDIALYGDTRPIHAQAVALARSKSLEVHVFEEGYMRPYWVTYERGGSNGHSRLMDMSVSEMKNALEQSDMDTALPPPAGAICANTCFTGPFITGSSCSETVPIEGFDHIATFPYRKSSSCICTDWS